MSLFRRAARTPQQILRGAARALTILVALPLLALAVSAAAEIFKCTDASGNVTYQNEPCPKNMKAGRVEIFDNTWTADRLEKDAQWRRNASEHRVVTGMPVRWVREALGEPAQIRDTATAGASEVWMYTFPDRGVQVGMLNDQVLWFRETPAPASPARVTTEADRAVPEKAAPEPQVPRSAPLPDRSPPELPVTRLAPPAAERPRDVSPLPPDTPATAPLSGQAPSTSAKAPTPSPAVSRGQDCKQAIASLGPPDRQREVPAPDAGSDPSTEYFYETTDSTGTKRLRIVCANGKVEGADRAVIR